MSFTRALKSDTTYPCRLNPVTSLSTSRYDNSGRVRPRSRVILRGPASPSSTPPASKWKRFLHPEGRPYFVSTGEFDFPVAVVTGANVEDLQTDGQILNCVRVANKELRCHGVRIPPRCELFLELAEDRASGNYYFVNHTEKALFWLEGASAVLLDIPAATSPSHLETTLELERLYWAHIEFFPTHHESDEQAFSRVVDDLNNIISDSQSDRLTSGASISAYTADRCRQLLKLLSKKRGQSVEGYALCHTARLAGALMDQRLGQQSAQLDRLLEMVAADDVEHTWLSTMANLLMWDIPQRYVNLLEDLYVDEKVYADRWRHFMSFCLADWSNSLLLSLMVFIISKFLLTNVRGGISSMSIPSVLFCLISIFSSLCLRFRHHSLMESSAAVGARYLGSARSSTSRFLPLSIGFSLPGASYLWGLCFLMAQIIFLVFHVVSALAAFVVASVIVAVLVFIRWVTNSEGDSQSPTRSHVRYSNDLDAPEGEVEV